MIALMPKYRFEVLVPLFYNDGTPVESEHIDQVISDLIEQFGAYRCQPAAPYEGAWTDVQPEQAPTVYRDRLLMLTVDTDRDESIVQWFADFKLRLAEMLRQLEIYLAVTEIFWL
jgi:hypothetical protein